MSTSARVPDDLSVPNRPLRDVVLDTLRKRIVSGSYPPRTRLVEGQLAQDLCVSRNPIREAIRLLEAEGLVETRPRRGAIVSSISEEEVYEFFEVRETLEPLAARLASRRADKESASFLHSILDASEDALLHGKTEKFGAYNVQFHSSIVELAENSTLQRIIFGLHGRAQWVFTKTAARMRGQHSLPEHRELADAIIENDEVLAEALAKAHIAKAWKKFRVARGRNEIEGA